MNEQYLRVTYYVGRPGAGSDFALQQVPHLHMYTFRHCAQHKQARHMHKADWVNNLINWLILSRCFYMVWRI